MIRYLIFLALFGHSLFALPSTENLSLEEKVGQLLIVHFNGETPNDNAKTMIQEAQVGGIFY
jgi:beta-N-acetylhexosaminidase